MDTISPLAPTQPGRPSRPSDASRTAARDRRGSILIFVVGILLLLAIIATAFLGTSRSDRTSTQQNANNTQADLLLEGVVNAMKGVILSDARYNAAADGYDSPIDDKFLASRVPVPFDSSTAVSAVTGSNPAIWPALTGPQLDTIYSNPFNGITYTVRNNLAPASFTTPSGSTIPGFAANAGAAPNWVYNSSSTYLVPAIDADGDGIADAGMVKLPIGQIAGLTYYYGARVVDLNSAINFNTAVEWNTPPVASGLVGNFYPANVDLKSILSGASADRTTQGNALLAYTTQNVSLAPPVTPYDDNAMARTDFTFSSSYEAYWMQLGRRLENPGYANATTNFKAFDINNTVALASGFILKDPTSTGSSIENALKNSLVGDSTATAPISVPIAAYTPGEEMNWYDQNFNYLAGLTNANPQPVPLRALFVGTNAVGNDAAADSLSSSYSVETWTTVQNGIPKVYNFGDVASVQLDGAGKIIDGSSSASPTSPISISRNYVCILPHTASAATAPGTANGVLYWSLLGGVNKVQKIDVNTADFGELWWGFRRLMAANSSTESTLSTPPFTSNVSTTPVIPGRMFKNTVRDPAAFPTPPATIPAGAHWLTSSEMLQIRSALAAVNTMDLRDADDNVTARQISTYDYTVSPPTLLHKVTVFGTERQPYIVEVYVNNDTSTATGSTTDSGANPKGYVGIVLYNPYPGALTLNGWTLGMIRRDTSPTTTTPSPYPLTIQPLIANQARFDNSVVVPPHGYLVLENFKPATTAPLATDPVDSFAALHRPTNFSLPATAAATAVATATTPADGDVSYKYVPGLEVLIADSTVTPATAGYECVLLRPRICDLTAGTTGVAATAPVDDPDATEGSDTAATTLFKLVPVDSYDCTGMRQSDGTTFSVWDYTRPTPINLPNSAWKWTIGAQPNVTGTAPVQPQGNPPVSTFTAGGEGSSPKAMMSFDTVPQPTGAPAAGTPTPLISPAQPGVQINNTDWPSPYRATAATANQWPEGSFAREADMLQIPFIGGYRVDSAADNAATGQFTEMNALPMDASFADDEDTSDDVDEQVGRFCPLSTMNPGKYVDSSSPIKIWPNYASSGISPTPPVDYYDFGQLSTTSATPTADTSKRSHSIFDIFTAHSPLNASLPAVGADEYQTAISLTASTHYTSAPMPVQTVDTTTAPGTSFAVADTGSTTTKLVCSQNLPTTNTTMYKNCLVQVLTGTARGQIAQVTSETIVANAVNLSLSSGLTSLSPGDGVRILGTPPESVGTEGLVNVNTAPWYVLARLPMVTDSTGAVVPAENEALAQAIVQYRDGNPAAASPDARNGHGPFRSIADLNRVLDPGMTIPLFELGWDGNSSHTGNRLGATVSDIQVQDATHDFGNKYGDLSPVGGVDGVGGDFENRYLVLSRISNLITTRSDKFVVYVDLQGWRNAGQSNATLVTQRRAAIIVDRNAASSVNPAVTTTRVPSH